MMKIDIAGRLRPFSHAPGALCLIPGTTRRVQIYPNLFRIHDMKGAVPELLCEVKGGVKGPVKDFTIQQDLEKGEVNVWGHSADGYFKFGWQSDLDPLLKKERLSLGEHKAQNWCSMRQRASMSEVFPIWLRLGQLLPSFPSRPEGTLHLLNICETAINERKIVEIAPLFRNVFLCGFEGMLSPRLKDADFLGFELPPIENSEITPLALLTEGARLIRSLFVQEEGSLVKILPALPVEFHCGRFTHIALEAGCLDIEWSKKTIRRMIFKGAKDCEKKFEFQHGLKRFRLRTKGNGKGQWVDCGAKIEFAGGHQYFFDNFQK